MTLGGLIAMLNSGPTTMKTATGSGKILPMNRIMLEASYGRVVIIEVMQMDAGRVNMIFGSIGRVLRRKKGILSRISSGSPSGSNTELWYSCTVCVTDEMEINDTRERSRIHVAKHIVSANHVA